MNASLADWLQAFRLRTLPLALACIGMGAFLAAYHGNFHWGIFVLCLLTTLFLQVLSNLANDYGDSIHGADSDDRQGPKRMVQAGIISNSAMKSAIILFVVLSLVCGSALLFTALWGDWYTIGAFYLLGIGAIVAAIAYTNGKRPYGYAGLGDLFVLIFFGLIAVGGTYTLFVGQPIPSILLPALSCGLFSVGVLNVNNIRDIESDEKAGKRSIPVRLGRKNAILYHTILLASGWGFATIFMMEQEGGVLRFLFVLSLPLFLNNMVAVRIKSTAAELDPYLKQLAISTLIFVILFGLGLLFN